MKTHKPKLSLSTLLAIISTLTAVAALIFSWQANVISSKQATPKVVLLSADLNGVGTFPTGAADGGAIGCAQLIRLANLGGTATSITNFGVQVRYKDSQFHATSNRNALVYEGSVDPRLAGFKFGLVKPDSIQHIEDSEFTDPSEYTDFPIQVSAYSTVEINSFAQTYSQGNSFQIGDLEAPYGPEQEQHPVSPHGLPPLEISYSFTTADGQVVTTPFMICFWMK